MSDSEDENYATFGIPLEPLDEENLPRKKAVTIEDQYAYDTQGRRRFHGAFTGGFSAGYFNTVGTRDGWKPQQFKSSRASKAKAIEQQPEDFMDEEDVSIFGIAPKGIRANSDYEYHGQKGTKRRRAEAINDQSLSYNPVLKDLLRPVRETIGIVLLKKMGWKPGQGVGNRVTKKEKIEAKRRMEKVKVYGCSLNEDEDKKIDSNIDDSDDETINITFAPDDYEPFRFKGKDNYFGIGYSGLNRQNVLSNPVNTEYNYQSSNTNFPIHGHAFGVGAFEADDDDIYEREDMSRYDSVLGPERKSKTRWSEDNVSSNDRRSNCIDGFIRAIDKLNCRKIFAPPHLPKDYHAVHLVRKSRFFPPIPRESVTEKKKSLNVVDRSRILSDVNLTEKPVQQRQIDTNEQALSSKISSDLVPESSNSLKYRDAEDGRNVEKLKTQITTSWVTKLDAKKFVSGGTTGMERITPGLLSKSTNLNDFSTFADVRNQIDKNIQLSSDADKQRRLEFCLTPLKDIDDKRELEKIQTVQSMAVGEGDQELVEFKRSAKLVEKVQSNDTNINSSNDYTANITDTLEKENKEAARLEMFGKLTREISEWQPSSIVCKRFNIPEPKNSYAQTKPETKIKFSVFNSLNFDTSSRFLKATDTISKGIDTETSTLHKDKLITNHASTSPTHCKTFNMNNELPVMSAKMKNFEVSYEKIFGKTVHDKSEDEEETEEKFKDVTSTEMTRTKNLEEKKDLFRAIFLSSSDESETETEENMDNEVVKSVLIGNSLKDVNILRNTSPPRGIFAKLDLDDLVIKAENVGVGSTNEDNIKDKQTNLHTQSEPPTTIEKNLENKSVDTLQTSVSSEVYGPMLPSRLIKDGNALTDSVKESCTDSSRPIYKSVVVSKVVDNLPGKWVEMYKEKKSKKVKKKHKHKEHKSSKSKRKSKKHKR